MRVLVIAPHPDDETLGCGGTIAKYVDQGAEVQVLVVTNASVGAPELFTKEQVTAVRGEAEKAHAVLGCLPPRFLDLPAPQLDQFPQYRLAQEIGLVVAEFQPRDVYIPFIGDLHVDHTAVARASLVALRPHPGVGARNIYMYETMSETEWGSVHETSPFIPNHFVPVGTTLDRKLSALACFASQMREFPDARSAEAVEALAKYRGASAGCMAAEAFMVVRQVAN